MLAIPPGCSGVIKVALRLREPVKSPVSHCHLFPEDRDCRPVRKRDVDERRPDRYPLSSAVFPGSQVEAFTQNKIRARMVSCPKLM
jgi:hypothetical protein